MKTSKSLKKINYSFSILFALLAICTFSISAENYNVVRYNIIELGNSDLSDSSKQSNFYTNAFHSTDYNNGIVMVKMEGLLAESTNFEKISSESVSTNLFYEVLEKEIILEDWMLNSNHNFWDECFIVDREDEIELQEWMLDASKW